MAESGYPEGDIETMRALYAAHRLDRTRDFVAFFEAAGLELPDEIERRFRVHRMSSTRAYQSWRAMLNRCNNPNSTAWENYGGRGVKVCRRWLVFANFYDDMGERPPGMSLDRINPEGDYRPQNCRWASAAVQAQNTRRRRSGVRTGMLPILDELDRLHGVPSRAR